MKQHDTRNFKIRKKEETFNHDAVAKKNTSEQQNTLEWIIAKKKQVHQQNNKKYLKTKEQAPRN